MQKTIVSTIFPFSTLTMNGSKIAASAHSVFLFRLLTLSVFPFCVFCDTMQRMILGLINRDFVFEAI